MTLGLGGLSGGKVPGKLPHIPQLAWSYPSILEEPNRRVPASGPLLPPLVRIAAVAIGGLGSCHSGIRWFWALYGPAQICRRKNITSLVCAVCRRLPSDHGSDALLPSTVPSCRRAEGRDARQVSRPNPPSVGSRRGNADQAPGPLRFESLGYHPMGTPRDRSSVRPPRFVHDPHIPRCT